MQYRGIITFDFTGSATNDRTAISVALIQAGWLYVETTTFAIETPNLNAVWRGIEIVAKGSAKGGPLTSLSFNITAASDFTKSRPHSAQSTIPNALKDIEALPFPKP